MEHKLGLTTFLRQAHVARYEDIKKIFLRESCDRAQLLKLLQETSLLIQGCWSLTP